MKRYTELSDLEVDAASMHTLRAEYKKLRDHHIEETTALIQKLERETIVKRTLQVLKGVVK